MTSVDVPTPTTASSSVANTANGPSRPHGGHRGGRGRVSHRRGRGRGRGRGDGVAVVDGAQQQQQPEGQPQPPQDQEQQRRPRRGRGRGRGASHAGRSEVVTTRTFRGRLTRPNEPASSSSAHGSTSNHTSQGQKHSDRAESSSLRPDASVFVPGRRHQALHPAPPSSSTTSTPKQPRRHLNKPTRSLTKSVADNITTRIHEDISNGLYECPICTSELGPRSKVWSCRQCWTVFHLHCIKKWSTNEGSVHTRPRDQEQQDDPQLPPARQWRCPGCNLPQDTLPSGYTCWCEKEMDIRSLPGLPPHSCGQSCSRSREGCPHPCDSVCHAGPCAPCQAMGPVQSCYCGRHEAQKKCVDTDYTSGWSCRETCEEVLPCLQHTCQRACHEGLCGECEELVPARCYCGKVSHKILCNLKEEERESRNQKESWVGSFTCPDICGRLYDCGIHQCEKLCHPQELQPSHCPTAPDMISYCTCGKTKLADMDTEPRKTCTDPIPNCQKSCDKLLKCGHTCPKACHTGPCPPCFVTTDISCMCGRSTSKTLCHQGKLEPPSCMRVCKAALNCGRHVCGERCCTGERKAIDRLATKKKLKSMNVRQTDETDIEAEHICTRVCGRLLKCGTHECQELCHRGPCARCPEAIFHEITCNCGRSVLYPPLPCGTGPPPCNFNCGRAKRCGHPQTPHNCHTDDEACPKCPFLTEKRCLCGKKVLKNQPCWLVDGRCGLVCGQELQCGSHTCKKECHRPGDCEDSTTECQQPCGKVKKQCSHICTEPCHAPFPCPEKTPCQSKIIITCQCGRMKQEKRCGASKDKDRQGHEAPSSLPCDEECGRIQRNRAIASAFGLCVDPSASSNAAASEPLTLENLPYSKGTLDMYMELASSSSLSAIETCESKLYDLALSMTDRSARFPPARANFRAFVHSLAEDWGFTSESFDPEPHRHVVVYKAGGWLPPSLAGPGIGIRGMSVADCAKFRDRERMKERVAKREAAAERTRLEAVLKDASSASANDGWAQVVSRKRPGTSSSPIEASPYAFGTTTPNDLKGKLVLRSGIGAGRNIGSNSRFGALGITDADEGVVEDWEEEVAREEREMEEKMDMQHDGSYPAA
ncbi:FKBP12-associated protein [Microsporum audouinii]